MSYGDWEFWFSYTGRMNRQPYFFAGLVAGGLIEARKLLPMEGPLPLLYLPILALAAFVAIMLGIKRCHDRGRSGWFMLINVVPVLNLWPLIELTFFRGTPGPNEYGDDPLAQRAPATEAPTS